ncbi:hypothetical protein INS49_001244 [Diaporthe citri]|uniref:uncharacterized protein n=1 Tax=Diaporthe citri TaxID=83186 RepID=UPI001C8255CD|nr:uncharacterized protein INS49_001244 [Diaporthe citri]KAG6367062.1 hypothetical protein INS49_001244 [Diaporthe citri]
MRHQQTSARQYARPGCCYDKPIVINDDEQTAPTRTKTKPISNHTATWLEAKARGRWQTPTTTTAESTFTNEATCLEQKAGDRWQGSVNRPAVRAETSQRCRKRAFADVGDDSDETNGGGKRLRIPEMGMAEGEGCPDQHTSQINPRPFHRNNRYQLTNPSHLITHSRLTKQSHLTKIDDENPASELAELEAGLRTMQRNMDLERATIRDIQKAEEQARIQKEEKQAREAEIREQNYRFTVQSSLHKMWQDCDREREAVEERRNIREREEREEREEAKRRERQAEQERFDELSNMEATLKSMWKAHDLERGIPAKIRPGQLSEAGQRRVRERAEKLRHQKQ